MAKKITQEEAEIFYEQYGCKLLDKITCNKDKLHFICKCGKIGYKLWINFRSGPQCCTECGKKIWSEQCQYTIDEVREILNKHGCTLLSDTYRLVSDKIKYKCRCGNIVEKKFNQFLDRQTCKMCPTERLKYKKIILDGENIAPSEIDKIKKYYEKHGSILLSNEYINCKNKLEYICKCGRKDKKRLEAFKHCPMCKFCSMPKLSDHGMWNPNREAVKKNQRFRRTAYSLIHRCLRYLDKEKKQKTYDILGYTPKQLIDHIENHQNWKNVKDKKWHIDHIFPIKAFVDYNISDMSIINCLENLQPLLADENHSKNDNYNKEEFEEFLRNKGYNV